MVNMKKCVYSVLIVSASDKLNNALTELLPESDYSPVCMVSSIPQAQKAVENQHFDHVIINLPLPDSKVTDFAIDTCKSDNTVVLILVREELKDDVEQTVTQRGIFTLSKPTSKHIMASALGWMATAREMLRKFEKNTLSTEKKIEELRIVNRAKWMLINEIHMSEPEAHRYIEKQSMDRCISKKEVAEEIIKTYL